MVRLLYVSANEQQEFFAAMSNRHGAGKLKRLDFYTTTESRYYAAIAVGIWCANWELGCEAQGIQGHFSVLTAEDRGIYSEKAHPQLPRYDVSWVLNENI